MLLPLSVKLGKLRTIFEYTKSFFGNFFLSLYFILLGLYFRRFGFNEAVIWKKI